MARTKEAAGAAAKTRKVCKTTAFVEMNGLSVSMTDIQNAVKKAVKSEELAASEIRIYVNAYEQTAYYTVDGVAKDEYRVDLKTL